MDLPDDPSAVELPGGVATEPLHADASAYELRQPFFFAGGRTGVLVIHGFSGTPFEVRPLGEGLAARGYTVYGPRLSGHGETSALFARSTHADWVASIAAAFAALRARVERVYVCGLSLGGLLSLDLASRRGGDPEAALLGIASLAAPIWLTRGVELAIRVTKRLGRVPSFTLPKWAGSDVSDPLARARNNLAQGAVGLPIPSVMSLHAFMAIVRAELPEVRVPTLLVHSRRDHTAPFSCMAEIARSLGTRDVQSVTLERSFHVLPLDVEHAVVLDAVAAHLARLENAPAPA